MGRYSTFLFAAPSFTEGMARILDFGDTLTEFNRSPTPDLYAIDADWNAVGEDMEAALEQFLMELNEGFIPQEVVSER